MRKLRRMLTLTMAEWALLFIALPTVVLIRLGLWVLPFRVFCRMIGRVGRPIAMNKQPETPRRVAWAVCAISRCVPRATCLTQALSTQVILALLGIPATLRIGVASKNEGSIDAHAWLECGDRVVIGWENRGRFIPFPPIEIIKP